MSPPDSFELSDYTAVLRRGWWTIALAGMIGLAAATAYTQLVPKTYTATAAVYVSAPSTGAAQVANGRTNGVVDLDTEAQIVQSATVASIAKKMLNSTKSAAQLSSAVGVTVPANTQVLQISCSEHNAVAAAHCAHAFAAAYLQNRASATNNAIKAQVNGLQVQMNLLQQKITKLSAALKDAPRGSTKRLDGTTQLSLYNSQLNSLSNHVASLLATSVNTSSGNILSDASTPRTPSSPRRMLALPSGLAAGLLLGLIIAFWRSRSDKSIRGARDVEALDLPVLLDTVEGKKRSRVALAELRSRLGQAFIELAHSLTTTLGQGNHVVLVVGASEGYAGTLTAANLAAALTTIGADVALVSTDRHSSAAAQLFGVADSAGFAEIVLDEATVGDVERRPTDLPRLRIVTPGQGGDAAAYRLERETIERLVKRLHAVARYIIFEAPPAAYGADAYALAAVSDAAIVAVEMGRTVRDEVGECVRRLDRMGAAVLGAVLLQPLDKAPARLDKATARLDKATAKTAQSATAARPLAVAPVMKDDDQQPAAAASEADIRQDTEQTGHLVYSTRKTKTDEPDLRASWPTSAQPTTSGRRHRTEWEALGGSHARPSRPFPGNGLASTDGTSDPSARG